MCKVSRCFSVISRFLGSPSTGKSCGKNSTRRWLGITYNFCWPHHELSHVRDSATGKRHVAQARTPAMAAGLTDHVWSISELLCYKREPHPHCNCNFLSS